MATKISYDVVDTKGKVVSSVELSQDVFGVELKPYAVHQTVRWQRAKARAGTHSVLTKGMMKGGNRKPWRQKGTGRARSGSNTSPIWVGGGIAHGPHPRSYEFRLSKRTRLEAITTVLTDRAAKKQLLVVKGMDFGGKTKNAAACLEALGVAGKRAVVVLPPGQAGATLARAARNICGVTVLPIEGLNCFDLMKAKTVVTPEECLAGITERYSKE